MTHLNDNAQKGHGIKGDHATWWTVLNLKVWTQFIPQAHCYLLILGPLGEVKGGIDIRCALVTDGRELEGNGLCQAVAGLQLQRWRLCWNLVEISGKQTFKSKPD